LKGLLFGLVLVGLALSQRGYAQPVSPPPMFGCDPSVIPAIEAASERFDYLSACDVYRACMNASDVSSLCQLESAASLLSDCGVTDKACRNEALLHAAALTVLDSARSDPNSEWESYSRIVDSIPLLISNFAASNFQLADAALDEDIVEWYQNKMLTYMVGLVLEMSGDSEAALDRYETTLTYIPDAALVRYSYGLLLGEAGRTTEASFETAWLEAFVSAYNPDLRSLIEPLTQNYPFDETRLEIWWKYPLIGGFHSYMVGNYFQDLTESPPTPIQLVVDEESGAILVVGLAQILEMRRDERDIPNIYILRETSEDMYEVPPPHYGGLDSSGFSLVQYDNLFIGNELLRDWYTASTVSFMLTQQEASDPRQVFGEPSCEGGVISRLRPGMQVVDSDYSGAGFRYAESPGELIDLEFGFDIPTYVIGEPVCFGNELWWQVTDGQTTGWSRENMSNNYYTNPAAEQSQSLFYCPTAPFTRLYVGGTGRVIPDLGVNNVRDNASLDANVLGTLTEDDVFTVTDGSICADGYAWWFIETGEFAGWTAEGEGDTYWLEPIVN